MAFKINQGLVINWEPSMNANYVPCCKHDHTVRSRTLEKLGHALNYYDFNTHECAVFDSLYLFQYYSQRAKTVTDYKVVARSQNV